MTGLKILNVSHNVIEKIPRNTFPKLFELHTVDISYNKLHDIWNSVFQTLLSLRFLNMSHNSLSTIKGSTFGALHTLLDLDLSHNELSDVNKAALARCASLRMLTLHNNSLTEIFQLPISLNHLDLSHNAISNIPPLETWPTMNSLLSLDLSYNMIGDSLERGAFSNLLTLQRLNLEGNGMTKVPWESLSELSTLQFLIMQVRWYFVSPIDHLLVSGH
jgi:Leucine-rich repeat (LRR) protein